MKVVVDNNLHLSAIHFPETWEITPVDGREMAASDVKDAEALIVRSVTTVDEALLRDSAVGFVGTATSGLDHIDQQYLKQQGIKLVDAAGSNANAVCDYVFAALAHLVLKKNLKLKGKTVGVIGAGNVGRRLLTRLEQLELKVIVCDPFVEQGMSANAELNAQNLHFCSLSELTKADVISLHVPLTDQTQYPTRAMIDDRFLNAMADDAVLINTCRGEVIDEAALLQHLKENERFLNVSDVWCNEPMVNSELIDYCQLATPHIAGYSRLAKATAVRRVVNALLHSADGNKDVAGLTGYAGVASPGENRVDPDCVEAWQVVTEYLPLLELTKRFRRGFVVGDEKAVFDSMRVELTQRKEFREVELPNYDKSTMELLEVLGFSGSQYLRNR